MNTNTLTALTIATVAAALTAVTMGLAPAPDRTAAESQPTPYSADHARIQGASEPIPATF